MGHVARIGKKNAFRDWTEKPEENRPLGRPRCRDGRILKWILKEAEWLVWAVLIWLSENISGEIVHEPSRSIQCEELLG